MFKFSAALRYTVFTAITAAAIGLAYCYITPKAGGQFANSPSAQVTDQDADQDVYRHLTTPTDDDDTPVETEKNIAKIVIKASSEAEMGQLVRLDVTASKAESFKWLLVPNSADFEVYDNGKRAVFSAREAGEYMFIVACAYKGTVAVTTHVVRVGNPVPKPGDYPIVERPNTGAAISEWVPYWCSLTVRPEEETRKLSESFEGIAATISAGVNTTPGDISKATSDANRQALGDSLEAWKPFLLSLQNEFKNRATAGTLVSAEQHAEMWREVAKGLRAYADLFETSN